ncbi:MAG: alpha/beta fold hydrolase [Actinomycetota bacterium]
MRRRDLRLDPGRMRVWEAGSGPTLLAIHGVGGSGRYFAELAERVGDRYRVVAPDLLGFGGSDKPDARYDRAFHLGCLDAAVADVDGPVTLVGHSLGGLLAALWASANPGRVAGLAIAAAPFPWADGEQAWMRDGAAPPRRRGSVRALKVLVPLLALPIGVAQGFPAGVSLDYGRQRFGPRVRTLWWTLHDPDALADLEGLRSLRAPALLAFAQGDRSVPPEHLDRWAAYLPEAERRLLPAGDHQFLLRDGVGPVAEWLLARETAS